MIKIIGLLTAIVETIFTVNLLAQWGVNNVNNASLLLIWIMSMGGCMIVYSCLYVIGHKGSGRC